MIEHSLHTSKNPILPGRGVCDPHVHVFDDRVFLFAGHDTSPDSADYDMRDWQIWSSQDLVSWKLERSIKPDEFFMGATDKCWAIDAAYANGKYYLYFSHGNEQIGVAVADSPSGPYFDALGAPLMDGTVTTTREYDPSVFFNNGSAYIVFGGPEWAYGPGAGYFIARLDKDMTTLSETPRRIELDHEGDDKVSLNRIGDRYYLTFASHYATSESFYGPYHYMGNTGASTDHGSYFSWNGQLFNAFTVYDPSQTYRSTGICYVHQRQNGELQVDQLIVEYGVGQYDGRWNKIEAEWFMKAANVEKRENPRSGFDVVCKANGTLLFPNIRHLAGRGNITFYAACTSADGATIKLYDGEDSASPIATVEICYSGHLTWRSYRIFRQQLSNLPETFHLRLDIEVVGDGELRLDYLAFH